MKLTSEQIERLASLEDENGILTPDAVVADAKHKDSPLHDLFDWDVKKAAHNWWLERARQVLRVRVEITTNTVTVKAPLYVSDSEMEGQGYRSTVALQRDPVTARTALIEELKRASGVITRARDLAVALNMADEIEAMLNQIVGIQTRLIEQEQELAKAS